MSRIHFLTLDPGDRFRFSPDGPLFERAPDRDGKVMVRKLDQAKPCPSAILELDSCFVIPEPIDRHQGDDEEEDPS